jgi:hypothetical protein
MVGDTVTSLSKDIEDVAGPVAKKGTAPVTTPVELVYGDQTLETSASLSLEGLVGPFANIRATILVTPPPGLVRAPWDHRDFERTVMDFPSRVYYRKSFRIVPAERLTEYLPATSTVLLERAELPFIAQEVRLVLNKDHTAVSAFRLTLRDRSSGQVLVRVTRRAPP